MLTVGGLFSGIGGWELGLERAGMRVLWHCEQDPFCQRVLAQRFPGDPIYDDVRELRGADVESVDVLCGGFPCQDISVAGRGAGIDGTRSGLWSEYARLVGELRPRYVLVENVAALLPAMPATAQHMATEPAQEGGRGGMTGFLFHLLKLRSTAGLHCGACQTHHRLWHGTGNKQPLGCSEMAASHRGGLDRRRWHA